MPDATPVNGAAGSSSEELTRRVTELERELAKVREERDNFRAWCLSLADELLPPDPNWQPPPPEDTVDAWEVLDRLQKKYLGRPQ